jgi:hypothetical protein
MTKGHKEIMTDHVIPLPSRLERAAIKIKKAITKCPSEDFLSPLNHLDSMEPILIRGGAYSVDGQEPGERPERTDIIAWCALPRCGAACRRHRYGQAYAYLHRYPYDYPLPFKPRAK